MWERIFGKQAIWIKGGFFGAGGAIIGTFVFLIIFFEAIYIPFYWPQINSAWLEVLQEGAASRNDFLFSYWIVGLLFTLPFAVIPGLIAGLVNTYLLKKLIRLNPLTAWQGGIFGSFIGANLVLLPIFAGLQLFGSYLLMPLGGSGVLSAILIGFWHGHRMTKHIAKSRVSIL